MATRPSLLSQTNSTEQFAQFFVFQKFMEYITDDIPTSICPVFDFCSANGDICNATCMNNFNDRYDYDNLCPYFLFLHSYGLTSVKIS